jgi:galactokinase
MEDVRVKEAGESLRNGDLVSFGRLMKESHESLSKDYQVSCKELDFLAEESWKMDYVLGSRMMGGGFGGCTINLLVKRSIPEFKSAISKSYQKAFSIEPEFIEVIPSDGARIVK